MKEEVVGSTVEKEKRLWLELKRRVWVLRDEEKLGERLSLDLGKQIRLCYVLAVLGRACTGGQGNSE